MQSVHPNLNPEAIFERGFITKEEAESVHLSDYAHKVKLDADGDIENIWIALLTEEDKARYNDDSSTGEEFKGILLNHALCWYPNHTWGRVMVGKTNGNSRPVIYARDQTERLQETHDAYMEQHEAMSEARENGEYPDETPEGGNIQAVCEGCSSGKLEYKGESDG